MIQNQTVLKAIIASIFTALPAFAQLDPTSIQTEVSGRTINGSTVSLSLPKDGSSCDPAIIQKNLNTLAAADILNASNLTFTDVVQHCYGHICPGQTSSALQDALDAHCKKAAVLQELTDLILKK